MSSSGHRYAPSHRYAFSLAELARVAAVPIGGAAAWTLLLQVLTAVDGLPPPRPSDLDRTILAEKAKLARARDEARILLVGDSSCLMDVDALSLARQLGWPVLNLGTLSYVDLRGQGRLVQRFVDANPGPDRLVVLLMHPEGLRRQEPSAVHDTFLSAALDEQPDLLVAAGARPLEVWLGWRALRERVLNWAAPAPLGGELGRAYGTTHELGRLLRQQRGSLVDPGRFDPSTARGTSEYRLAKSLEAASREFRRSMPPGWRLAVGITPVPDSFAGRDHPARVREMVNMWARWLAADIVLDSLPATIPDAQFASVTHLSANGVAEFTGALAQALTQALPAMGTPP